MIATARLCVVVLLALATAQANAMVCLNTAGIAELDTLPGVGPSTAQKILDLRLAIGCFGTLEDLRQHSDYRVRNVAGLTSQATAACGCNAYVPPPAPTACEYSEWAGWSSCSVTCGTGTQSNSRTVVAEATNGGTPCDYGSLTASQACQLASCPVAPSPATTLVHVTGLDLNTATNHAAHHTHLYYGPQLDGWLVSRRGQAVSIGVQADASAAASDVRVRVHHSSGPEVTAGFQFQARALEGAANAFVVDLYFAENAAVGQYFVTVAVGALCPAERHTTDGAQCTLPFTYDGVAYNDCTHVDDTAGEWCQTAGNADGWGYCTRSCQRTFPMAVLFNPWNPADQTYVGPTATNEAENEAWRQEYVLGRHGVIYQGLSDDFRGHLWDFDQFNGQNLLAALDMIREVGPAAADPVALSRHLSWKIGGQVCYGRWGDGDYTADGQKPSGGYTCNSKTNWPGTDVSKRCFDPSDWTGSTALLRQWLASGRKQVQFCQCYVFSGVTTTVSRSLGFAARTSTTFQSAHDTNANRAIEKYYDLDAEGYWIPNESAPTSDSVWSFHVWNELYFARPDITDTGYSCNGWQAVDATPQEESGGRYQMGPAPVECLRHNDATHTFDEEFVITEVNADYALHVRNAGEPDYALFDRFQTDPFGDEFNTVGLFISTKKRGPLSAECAAGGPCLAERHDITGEYKVPEPSGPGTPTNPPPAAGGGDAMDTSRRQQQRRAAPRQYVPVTKARVSRRSRHAGADVTVRFPGKVHWGHDFVTCVDITLQDGEARSEGVSIVVRATDYTGKTLGQLAKVAESVQLEPFVQKVVCAEIRAADYEAFRTRGGDKTGVFVHLFASAGNVGHREASIHGRSIFIQVP